MFLPKTKQSTTFAFDWDGEDWIYYPVILFGPAFRVNDDGRAIIDRWLGWAAAIGAAVMMIAIFGIRAVPEPQQLTAAYVLLAVVISLFVFGYRNLFRNLAAHRPDARLGPAWAQPVERLLLWRVVLHMGISAVVALIGADFAQTSAADGAWIAAVAGVIVAAGGVLYVTRFARVLWRRANAK